MFDLPSISSLFSISDSAQTALRTSGNWLPAPGWFATYATICVVAAIASILLLKDFPLAFKLGIAAAVLAFCTAIGYGYEAQGENKIIPKLNAANARIANDEARAESFRQDNAALLARLASESKQRAADRIIAAQKFQEALNAQNPTVSTAPIPDAASVPINTAIAEANDTAFGPGSGDAARALATTPESLTVIDWQTWGGKIISLYKAAADKVKSLQDAYNGVAANAAKAEAANPIIPPAK